MRNRHPKHKREYVRLDSVFPVEYQFLKNDKALDNIWHHGFTNNVSHGGMCLELLQLGPEAIKLLKDTQAVKLNLRIHIPIHRPASPARAKVLWFKEEPHHLSQCRVGLEYEEIGRGVLKGIMRFAYGKIILPRVSLALIIILLLGFLFSAYNNFRLSAYNKELIEKMVDIVQDSRKSRDELENIKNSRITLESRLKEASDKIQESQKELDDKLKVLEETRKMEKAKTELLHIQESEVQKLKTMLGELSQDKAGLRQKIDDLAKMEQSAQDKLREIKGRKMLLEKENFEKMYQWVKTHQNPRTGLVISFEGDESVDGQSFTYDQALAVIAFSYFRDFEQAGKILDFYLSKAKRGQGFYNSYYASSADVSEFIIHSGPNLWLGIAALQYTKMSGDEKYLPLAREIAAWILRLQGEDAQGGLRGGPDTPWYSTEHNLDGFAFFNMFYQIKKEPAYLKASQKILSWLEIHAYDNPQVPVKRGKGDATIATDTYAWSIASLGPQRLTQSGMDPEAIMKFAESNCTVAVGYPRPGGETIQVKGFDFAKQAHSARGGVVSSEWTAQMILSYKLLSGYFASQGDSAKEKLYSDKAEEYLEELTKMIIASPSRTGQGQGCLPYASTDFMDTGHGWMTPKGKDTGSLSATVYTIFAYYGFNPLELSSQRNER